jgi:hypothetical protein
MEEAYSVTMAPHTLTPRAARNRRLRGARAGSAEPMIRPNQRQGCSAPVSVYTSLHQEEIRGRRIGVKSCAYNALGKFSILSQSSFSKTRTLWDQD